jgi:hypothetical protein
MAQSSGGSIRVQKTVACSFPSAKWFIFRREGTR